MLHKKLCEKLTVPAHRYLYDLNICHTDHTIKQIIQNQVRKIRSEFRAQGIDVYAEKLKKFGNKGAWSKIKIQELERVIYNDKKPVPDTFIGQWRSIEFEAIFKNADALKDFTSAIRSRKTPYDKKSLTEFVTVKDDHSLRVDEDDKGGAALCKEIVVTYKAGDENLVEHVCAAMTHRAYINNTCGTHVHFDMRGLDEKKVVQCGHRLARAVPALKAILPKSRRNNKFCMTAINDMGKDQPVDPAHIDPERYTFINMKSYRRHKTIEVRGHSATLKADKILNWIALCEKIMTTSIRSKSENGEIKDPAELVQLYKLDGKLAAYVKERFEKFNTAKDIPNYASKPWAAVAVPPPIPVPPANVNG